METKSCSVWDCAPSSSALAANCSALAALDSVVSETDLIAVRTSSALADYFIAVFEGSVVLGRSSGDLRIFERNLLMFEDQIRALFRR